MNDVDGYQKLCKTLIELLWLFKMRQLLRIR